MTTHWKQRIAFAALAIACVGFPGKSSAQQSPAQQTPVHDSQDKSASTVLWEPPVPPWPEHLPKATVNREMVGTLQVSGVPVVLEKTTLDELRQRFGGMLGTRGEGGKAEAWLCYRGSNGDRHWIIWLTSGGIEGRTRINGFQWETLAADENPDSRCQALPKDGAGIQLPVAIYPGMTGEAARKILGQPTVTRSNLLIFLYQHRKSMFRPKPIVQNTMAVAVRDELVQEIDVERITSN